MLNAEQNREDQIGSGAVVAKPSDCSTCLISMYTVGSSMVAGTCQNKVYFNQDVNNYIIYLLEHLGRVRDLVQIV